MKSYAFAVFSFNRMIVFHNFQNVRNFQLFLNWQKFLKILKFKKIQNKIFYKHNINIFKITIFV